MGKKKQKQGSKQPQQQQQQSTAQSRLNALFHMSIEHSDREKLKNVQPMDEQSRKFLEGALKEHMEDPIQKLKEKIAILQQFVEGKLEDDETLMEALEEISYQTEIIDFANDFHKLGGLRLLLQKVIPTLIKENKLAVLEKALEPIEVCAQNNPYIQNVIMTEFPELIEQLLQLLLLASPSSTTTPTSATTSSSTAATSNKEIVVKRKTLTTISSILSNNERSSDFLVAHEHAIKLFLQLLQTQTDQSIKRKTLFLILNMIIANPAKVSEAFISAGLLPVLSSIIDPRTAKTEQAFGIPDNDTLENALHVLDNMLQIPTLKQSLTEKLKQEGISQVLDNLGAYLVQQVRTPAEDELLKIRELTSTIKSHL